MPTNVSPEYRKAEQAFRAAREPRERLDCLKEMLRTIPKHKGTEHLQAEIKTRIKQQVAEAGGTHKGGARGGPAHSVHPAGAAQVVLIGPPNSGKSSLHVRLTGSHAETGPYPFTTQFPIPGMMPHDDVHFQLVDLPPVSAEFIEPWFINAVQRADAALLVIDVSDPASVDHVGVVRERLAERKIALEERWPGLEDAGRVTRVDTDDPFHVTLPTLLVGNKCDLDPDPDEVQVLEELLGIHYPAVTTSAVTGEGLDEIGGLLFRGLRVVRVYTKTPHGPIDHEKPFTVRHGQTVADVALLVHKDVAAKLKHARIWGAGVIDGQQIGPDHVVEDGNIVELHV